MKSQKWPGYVPRWDFRGWHLRKKREREVARAQARFIEALVKGAGIERERQTILAELEAK